MPTKPSYEDLEKRIAGLERAKRVLENAIDVLPQPVVVADAEDQIVYLNSSAKRRCQLTAKDAIGRFFPKRIGAGTTEVAAIKCHGIGPYRVLGIRCRGGPIYFQ